MNYHANKMGQVNSPRCYFQSSSGLSGQISEWHHWTSFKKTIRQDVQEMTKHFVVTVTLESTEPQQRLYIDSPINQDWKDAGTKDEGVP